MSRQQKLASYLQHEFHRFAGGEGKLEFADARGDAGSERIMKQRLVNTKLYPNNAIRTYGKPSFSSRQLSPPRKHDKTITAERATLINRIAQDKQLLRSNETDSRDISQLASRLTTDQEKPFNLDIHDDHYLSFQKPKLLVADLQYTFEERMKYINQPQVDKLHTDMRDVLANKYEPNMKELNLPKQVHNNHTVSPLDPARLLNRLVAAKQSLQKY